MAIVFESEQQKQRFGRLLEALEAVPVSGPLGEVRRFAEELSEARAAVDASGVQMDASVEGLSDR